MRKYFYLVTFSYTTGENEKSDFDLGVFSTKENALKKIQNSKSLPGFNQYGDECFKIVKFCVEIEKPFTDNKTILYSLSHEYTTNEGTFWTVFGYFSRYRLAKEKLLMLQNHSRIGKKYPNNFEINKVPVDSYNDWSEGFEKTEF